MAWLATTSSSSNTELFASPIADEVEEEAVDDENARKDPRALPRALPLPPVLEDDAAAAPHGGADRERETGANFPIAETGIGLQRAEHGVEWYPREEINILLLAWLLDEDDSHRARRGTTTRDEEEEQEIIFDGNFIISGCGCEFDFTSRIRNT